MPSKVYVIMTEYSTSFDVRETSSWLIVACNLEIIEMLCVEFRFQHETRVPEYNASRANI